MENTIQQVVSQCELPEKGRFLIEDWAKVFDVEVRTIRSWIEEHKIRTLGMGSKTIVDAEWWWSDILRGHENGKK